MIEQLASVSLSCSVVILLLLFLRPLLCRRYRAELRYWIWLALAVRLLVPLSPSWPASPVALPSLPETAVSFSVPLSGGETAVPAGGEVLTPAVPSLSVSGLLTAVWAAGSVVFLAWHLLAAFFFRRKAVRWSTMFQNGRPDVLMCKCAPSPKSCSPLSFFSLHCRDGAIPPPFREPSWSRRTRPWKREWFPADRCGTLRRRRLPAFRASRRPDGRNRYPRRS